MHAFLSTIFIIGYAFSQYNQVFSRSSSKKGSAAFRGVINLNQTINPHNNTETQNARVLAPPSASPPNITNLKGVNQTTNRQIDNQATKTQIHNQTTNSSSSLSPRKFYGRGSQPKARSQLNRLKSHRRAAARARTLAVASDLAIVSQHAGEESHDPSVNKAGTIFNSGIPNTSPTRLHEITRPNRHMYCICPKICKKRRKNPSKDKRERNRGPLRRHSGFFDEFDRGMDEGYEYDFLLRPQQKLPVELSDYEMGEDGPIRKGVGPCLVPYGVYRTKLSTRTTKNNPTNGAPLTGSTGGQLSRRAPSGRKASSIATESTPANETAEAETTEPEILRVTCAPETTKKKN